MNPRLVGFDWRKFSSCGTFDVREPKETSFEPIILVFYVLNTVCSLHHVTAMTCLEQTIMKCWELKLSCTAHFFKILHCFQLHITSQMIVPELCRFIYVEYNPSKLFTGHSQYCLSFKRGASSYFRCKPLPYKHCAGVYHLPWTTCGIFWFISFVRLCSPTLCVSIAQKHGCFLVLLPL